MTEAERYCLGLLAEEQAEAGCHIGRALRFGLDTLGQDGVAEREALETELGDVLAAIRFASLHGVVRFERVICRSNRKLEKLRDPEQRDSLGRPLAPQP